MVGKGGKRSTETGDGKMNETGERWMVGWWEREGSGDGKMDG